SNARTSDISSGEYAIMPLAPMKESDAPNEELRQAWEFGSMFRNGWENNVKSIDALPYVEAGSNARTSDISSGE
ncbi:hypothetical protein JDT47_22520, partial [Escherichia coli]|nr:hypothetical protein [Escherichia coli]